jgi:hypothetical protein
LRTAIDFNHNLDGLLLVAGDGVAEAVQMPIEVESRVVIDDNFATRDLVRAIHDQSAYYVVVLSQKQVRLILAFSDRVVHEFANAVSGSKRASSPGHSGGGGCWQPAGQLH